MTIFQTFTNSPTSSNISIAGLFTSNCSGGNVVWLKWWLYDCSCNFVSCGDITSLNVGGLTCGGCYNIKYQFELANCSTFTNFYPYQNVPFTPVICTGLPNMLDLEENAIVIKNTSEGKVFLSFDLKSNFEFDLSLYDVLGRKVKSENLFIEEGQSNREIETSSLKESYYMLIIKDTKSNFQKTQKVRISNN